MSEKKPKEAPPKAEAAGESPAPKKGGLVKIIIIALAAMAAGGAGSFFVLQKTAAPPAAVSGGAPPAAAAHPAAAEEEEPIVAPTKGSTEIPAGGAAASGGHGGGGEGAAAGPPPVSGPITVDLTSFTTNLNEPSGRRFLKVTLGLEVENQEAADELNRQMSDIKDSILILLSSQSPEDIGNVEGKERLRSQILNRTNNYMSKNKVRKVKYSEFIIQ